MGPRGGQSGWATSGAVSPGSCVVRASDGRVTRLAAGERLATALGGLGVRAVLVGARVAFLDVEDDPEDETDTRDQVDQEPHARLVDVVQTADADRDRGDQHGQAVQ